MVKKNKSVIVLVLSIVAFVLPVPLAALMTLFEPETNEAIAVGVMLGWAIGGFISTGLIFINIKQKNSILVALNAISMLGIAVLAFSFLSSLNY